MARNLTTSYERYLSESQNEQMMPDDEMGPIDARYYIDHVTDMLASEPDMFSDEEMKVLRWTATRLNQTHPDGDIHLSDILGTLSHHSDSVPDVDLEQAEEYVLDFLESIGF